MDPNLEYLLKQLDERISMHSKSMLQGSCTSYEEYKHVCGQVLGLEAACGIVESLKRHLETSDD